ncbi:hypothetical protein BZA05DRAFT_242107 [Tricharina praecox]|uniref:uncharacterized protein n=1 Tax=Tricharina praecox TaxID=43433 RepID=UPI00221ED039|nr:uncharacterized protein BZA05DRAFT_242107 [Tricharina praecox]KAI5840904.1 hypothetical protein BZA05DRAFT_242107 [Tricharina praecox]
MRAHTQSQATDCCLNGGSCPNPGLLRVRQTKIPGSIREAEQQASDIAASLCTHFGVAWVAWLVLECCALRLRSYSRPYSAVWLTVSLPKIFTELPNGLVHGHPTPQYVLVLPASAARQLDVNYFALTGAVNAAWSEYASSYTNKYHTECEYRYHFNYYSKVRSQRPFKQTPVEIPSHDSIASLQPQTCMLWTQLCHTSPSHITLQLS